MNKGGIRMCLMLLLESVEKKDLELCGEYVINYSDIICMASIVRFKTCRYFHRAVDQLCCVQWL